MKNFLFILRKPPHHGVAVQEALDLLLTTVAFDQPVSVLFLDDGVFQIKKGQQPEVQGLKDTAAMLASLTFYEVNDLYVETESLHERGLQVDDLCLPVKSWKRNQVAEWVKQFDVVFPD